MFYERLDSHMLEPRMGFLIDSGYEDMCNASNELKDDSWQKVQNVLPTPPCSPEELCYQGFPEFMQPTAPQNGFQQGLQVVPEEIPDDLVDTEVDSLPVLDISDEEMQKLTSPTIFDETMWQMHSAQPTQQQQQQPTQQPTCEPYDSRPTTVSDVNYISHGIRTVHISDQVVRSPAYSQSFVLTVNANPIQPLNTMGHLITREILATSGNSAIISDPNYMNERVNLVGPFDLTNLQALPESPTKRGRKIRRSISRGTHETVLTEELADDSEDSETTRATHNVLERRRREELKEKFQRLRDCLPELQDNDRAPKVLILKKACEYVKYLKQEEQRLLADKELEKQRLLILLKKRQMLAQALFSMQC
ncbi:transcriptional regulator Myc-B-like [Dendronephthya gigantea]|uniref:transcriptional regulator Myc-B-like n=1 Tax=Dendronephthya gigantea TaxID=151771 RepID=UPI001069D5FD|nr:transcriptional regulator Myc-B-like [Dendronephthya gigantea]